MSWLTTGKGFNFRQTLAYVTDASDEQFILIAVGGVAYPTTSTIDGESVTYGAEGDITSHGQARDRNAGNDRRLAGLNSDSVLSVGLDFRVDLPAAGQYTVILAAGDANYAQVGPVDYLIDNVTTLATITVTTGAANSFMDAAGNVWTQAQWPGSNVSLSLTFASTIFRMQYNATLGGLITHVRLIQQPAAGGHRRPIAPIVHSRHRRLTRAA